MGQHTSEQTTEDTEPVATAPQPKPDEPTAVVLDSIADGVFTVDSDWRITSFNRAAEQIVGVPREEALGRPCCEVFRADICEGSCALRRTMETGQPIVNSAVYIVKADGSRSPISVSTALLKGSSGEVIGGAETFRDLSLVEALRKELAGTYTFADIISKNHTMRNVLAVLPQIAESESTALISGESGTGKELVARAIHSLSPRKSKRFVPVNCGALPDTLLESELFGHVAGAFTDARRDRQGRFAQADGGTISLDEIGDSILLVAVADGAIGGVAREAAEAGPVGDGTVALHLSGALPASALAPIAQAGGSVGS